MKKKVFEIKNYLLIIAILFAIGINAQPVRDAPPTAIEFFDLAKNHIKLANYDNAIAAMIKAVELSPENILFKQELGKLYLINKQPKQADNIFTALLKDELADESTYKYATECKIAFDDFEAAKEIVSIGLEKFETSGLLYYTKGNLYDYYKEFSQALAAYEKGIELDPTFALNYYTAAKMQLKNPNNFLACIIYAETYIALDPFTTRTEEMKNVLFNGYNRLCILLRTDVEIVPQKSVIYKNNGRAFETKMLQTMEACKGYIAKTIDVKTLNLFRTKFIVEWFRKQPCTMPASIFSRQQLYIIEGQFTSYNNWLFGQTSNIGAYEKWLSANQGNLKDLNLFFKEHPFVPENNNIKKANKKNK